MSDSLRKSLASALALSLLSGCIATYRDFPRGMVGKPPAAKPYETLHYKISRFPVLTMGAGETALYDVFKTRTPFQSTEQVKEMPKKGLYVLVDTDWKPLTVGAIVWGYISIAFLTLLPSWSAKEGYRVNYHLYADGERKKTFSYELTRKGALWIVLLPLIWVNFFTYSEREALEATAYQFFKDADPLFAQTR